jgi:Peptidase C13 family
LDTLVTPSRPLHRRLLAATARKYRRLGGNLLGAVRLALPLPAPRRLFHFDLDQLFTLLLLSFAADILTGYAEAGEAARFWYLGWASEAIGTLAVLISCYVACRLARAPAATLALMVLILAVGIVLDIPEAVLLWGDGGDRSGKLALYVWLGYVVWFAVIGIRSMRLLLPQRRWPVALLGIVLLLGPLAPIGFGISYPFWYTPPPEEEADDTPLVDVEQVYYAQPTHMRTALFPIAAHQPGETSLYFLGFASWANQDVFLKEARFAQNLFDRKFGTADRSLLLVNNPATVHQQPLASVSNLGLALDGLAGKMDPAQDVLFLFLTSHGSPDHLAIRYDRFELDGLSAETLRHLLDEARIKWRVIAISACYSGSFIEKLKSPNTLIMTASRHDRTSFGCGNENDFTYFGEAYFSQALQKTSSFIDAFDLAKSAIAERESKEKLTPSEPQIFIGEAIRPKLAEIEARLEPPSAGH